MNQPLDIQKFKDTFLQCHVCIEQYDEEDRHPRIFPCLHGACFSCVKKLVTDEKLVCPICRHEYDVPNNDVQETFLKDFTRRDLLNFVQVHDSSAIIVCDNCIEDDKENKKQAINRCRECAQFLCKECSAAHQKVKATKHHQFIILETLKNKAINYQDFSFEGQCLEKEHNFEKLTLYCNNEACQTPLCMRCAFLKHQGHDLKDIDTVFEVKKEALEKQLEELSKVTQDQHNMIFKLENELRSLDKNIAKSQNAVDTGFAKCKDILKSRRNYHTSVLIKIKEEKYKCINQQQTDMQSLLDLTEQSCEFAKQALQYRNPSAFLLIERTISDRLRELKENTYETYPHKTTFVEFDESNMQSTIQAVSANLGSIYWTSAFLPKTDVIVPLAIQMPSSATIQIKLYDNDGNHIMKEKAQVRVEVTDDKNNTHSISAEPHNKLDSNCDTSLGIHTEGYEQLHVAYFKPLKPGKYNINVFVYGMKTPGVYYIEVTDQVNPTEDGKEAEGILANNLGRDFDDLTNKYLSCVVCKKEFDESKHFPRLMQCLHQIGDSCLHEKINESKSGTLKCPNCKEEYILDDEILKQFPRNFTWRQLHDFIFAQQSDKHSESDCCESKKQISHWCKECASFMCDDCKRAHGQLASTKWHTLLPLHDLSLPLKEVVEFCHDTPCAEGDHKNQTLPVYCCDCKKALCVLCVLTHNNNNELEHQRHIKPINKVYCEKIAETQSNMSKLELRRQEVKDIISRVQNEDKKLENAACKAEEDITKEFAEYENRLRIRKEQLISSVKAVRVEKKEVIRKQLEDLTFYKRLISESLDTSELALMFKNAPAFLLIEDTINERLKSLSSEEVDSQTHTSAQMKFALSETDLECKSYFSGIGYIDNTTAFMTSSDIVVPEDTVINHEVLINVNLFDSTGEKARGRTNSIFVQITSPKNDTTLLSAETSDAANTLRFLWKPKITGKHSICAFLEIEGGRDQSKEVTCLVKEKQDDVQSADPTFLQSSVLPHSVSSSVTEASFSESTIKSTETSKLIDDPTNVSGNKTHASSMVAESIGVPENSCSASSDQSKKPVQTESKQIKEASTSNTHLTESTENKPKGNIDSTKETTKQKQNDINVKQTVNPEHSLKITKQESNSAVMDTADKSKNKDITDLQVKPEAIQPETPKVEKNSTEQHVCSSTIKTVTSKLKETLDKETALGKTSHNEPKVRIDQPKKSDPSDSITESKKQVEELQQPKQIKSEPPVATPTSQDLNKQKGELNMKDVDNIEKQDISKELNAMPSPNQETPKQPQNQSKTDSSTTTASDHQKQDEKSNQKDVNRTGSAIEHISKESNKTKKPQQQREIEHSDTPKEQRETEESDTPKQQRETEESDTPKQQKETAQSDTPKQQRETEESDTPKKRKETAQSDTPKQQKKTEELDTPKQQRETEQSDTPKQQRETEQSDTRKQQKETEESDTFKQQRETEQSDTPEQQRNDSSETQQPTNKDEQQIEHKLPTTDINKMETSDQLPETSLKNVSVTEQPTREYTAKTDNSDSDKTRDASAQQETTVSDATHSEPGSKENDLTKTGSDTAQAVKKEEPTQKENDSISTEPVQQEPVQQEPKRNLNSQTGSSFVETSYLCE